MISIGANKLSLNDFKELVFKQNEVVLDQSAVENVAVNFQFLQQFSANKLIYGINTGFGPMAQYKIEDANLLQLQYNLIRSHSCGSGNLLSPILVKALMIARLSSLMKGYSGVHTDLVELLSHLINHDITPCIYEQGGVGASGDLVQLAHLALVLIGEGEVTYKDVQHPTKDIFNLLQFKPLAIQLREGLAILNGTAAMTGIGLVNIIQAKKLLGLSVMLAAMMNEVAEAYDDHYSNELNAVKQHPGQNVIAAKMRSILKDSKMIRNRSQHLYNGEALKENVLENKVQEYYSLRCVTQILGPIQDTISHAADVLIAELNSVNDNPVVDHRNQNVFHGGNFHGDYVSLEMDKLKIAITKLSMLSERQLNYLLNDKLNQKLPAFVNLGVPGLNFGMQGMQFTATSTVAENQTLSFPMYVHSIPNNNDNQDVVSMGCNAALLTKKVIDNSFTVVSIQTMALLQAIDYLQCSSKLSTQTLQLYTDIRTIFPVFVEDEPKYNVLAIIKLYFEQSGLAIEG